MGRKRRRRSLDGSTFTNEFGRLSISAPAHTPGGKSNRSMSDGEMSNYNGSQMDFSHFSNHNRKTASSLDMNAGVESGSENANDS